MAAIEGHDELPPDTIKLVVCDSDALTQLFCSKHEWILKDLHVHYGLSFAVTEAVEAEMLRPNRRQAGCSQEGFKKALEMRLIEVLNARTLGLYTTANAHVIYDSIELLGQQYNRIIDRGEAYTHAAAHVLKCAALSNDWKAIRDCDRRGKEISHPTLRAYDLLVFLFQSGHITEKDCDGFRKALHEVGETPHSAFTNRKFREGLPGFHPRLVDPAHDPVGSSIPVELGDLLTAVLVRTRPNVNS